MEKTKFIAHKDHELQTTPCHGGEGLWYFRDMMWAVDRKDRLFIKYIHSDIIPPGSSFGYHQHDAPPEEEWYICISGHGVMTLDGKDYDMGPGDISVCYGNGFHALKNTGNEDIRLVVIYASAIK